MYKPGQLLRAIVNGKKAKVYLTLSELDTDGKPRWRYAPGTKKAHTLIPLSDPVKVLGEVNRWPKKKS